jgi:hypothetical protein
MTPALRSRLTVNQVGARAMIRQHYMTEKKVGEHFGLYEAEETHRCAGLAPKRYNSTSNCQILQYQGEDVSYQRV